MRFLYYLLFLVLLETIVIANEMKSQNVSDEARRISKICAGCHGTNGAAPGPSIPIIGGQKSEYMFKVMTEYREGKRTGSVMLKIAQAYDDNRTRMVSEYFERQRWVSTHSKLEQKYIKAGKKLSEFCADCHGKDGKGDDVNPRIAGQHPDYLYYALIEYKEGKRGDVQEMSLVKDLSENDIRALAAYYASLK